MVLQVRRHVNDDYGSATRAGHDTLTDGAGRDAADTMTSWELYRRISCRIVVA
jgi:hypothetical protein